MNETKEDTDKVHQVPFNSYRKQYTNLSYKLLISGEVVLVKETMYVKLAATVLVVAEVMIGLAAFHILSTSITPNPPA